MKIKTIYCQRKGFTLLELMATLFIAAILMSISNMALVSFYNYQSIRNITRNLSLSLKKSYLTAITHQSYITIIPNKSWDKGWVAFKDDNYNFILDKTEKIIDKFPNRNKNILLISSNINCIIFTPLGLTRQCGVKNGLLSNGTISFKHANSQKCENNINLIIYRNRSRVCEANKKYNEGCICK